MIFFPCSITYLPTYLEATEKVEIVQFHITTGKLITLGKHCCRAVSLYDYPHHLEVQTK